MNLVIITADDLSYFATGIGGCEINGITPNIDELAKQGVYFDNAHTTVGLCQPSRSVLMTGLYPWNNGAFGFEAIKDGTETLVTILKSLNYKCGIMGKDGHLAPRSLFQWDYLRNYNDLDGGKTPSLYYRYCKEFLCENDLPFFLMVNSHDPHREFPAAKYHPDSVKVPCFLDDNIETRKELAQYYSAVNRCDETVGLTLRAIKESGRDALIVFTSDHGMAFPFVKANCYHYSSRIPLIYSHSSVVPHKDYHMVSGVDFLPTVIDALGLSMPHVDGRSYYELLKGGTQSERDFVYTCLCKNYPGTWHQTRAIHTNDYCYIRNFWSDGVLRFVEDGCLDQQTSYSSLSAHKKIHLRYRTPEEFYDLVADPYAQNSISDPSRSIAAKQKMIEMARKAKDLIACGLLSSDPFIPLL